MSTQTATTESPIEKASSGCPIHKIIEWHASESLVSRALIAAYGLIAYLTFFGTILYAIGFTTSLLVPKNINSGTPGSLLSAMLINGAMLLAFVVQHTIMARPRFKAWVTQFIPNAMERSTFVLLASLILAGTFFFWKPMPEVLWSIEHAVLSKVLTGISLIGWATVFLSSFMVSHFDLFGVRQVITNLKGEDYSPISFRLVGLYKLVRHPLMTGFLIAFWFTPTMTVGHLFFAIMTTGYILLGTKIEEHDLIASFGEQYLEYKRNVRGLIPMPRFGRREGGAS
jgi:protein-S-isoprenylcysteine O-methyltransferase Ste14